MQEVQPLWLLAEWRIAVAEIAMHQIEKVWMTL